MSAAKPILITIGNFLVNGLVSSPAIPHRVRLAVYRLAGIRVEPSSTVLHGVSFRVPAHVDIGERCFINTAVVFDGAGQVDIEDDVQIAADVKIITISHELGPSQRRGGHHVDKPIRVGRGCWLCTGAMILPGVSVAPGCVIAAGAVVTHDTEPDGIYMGVPARRVRDLS